mmetsp:Transcript_28328/g.47006  ORF Transcript_28328/g.47006 Transcript_28328/m.47006 type:complete len:91 (+) Transcript_28328:755-1027(+)
MTFCTDWIDGITIWTVQYGSHPLHRFLWVVTVTATLETKHSLSFTGLLSWRPRLNVISRKGNKFDEFLYVHQTSCVFMMCSAPQNDPSDC